MGARAPIVRSSATRCILGTEDDGLVLEGFVARNWQWRPQVSASPDDHIANRSRLELSSVWSSLARSRSGRFWPRFSSSDEGLDA